MDEDKLLAIAEGRLCPTADEQRLLESDAGLRRELQELQELFAGLRQLPEPQPDDAAIAGILPSVREAIENRRARSPLVWIALRPAAVRVLAAAASLVIIAGLLFLGGSQPASNSEPELNGTSRYAIDYETDSGDLINTAMSFGDLEMYGEISEVAESDPAEFLIEDSAYGLYQDVAQLDNEQFAALEDALGLYDR